MILICYPRVCKVALCEPSGLRIYGQNHFLGYSLYFIWWPHRMIKDDFKTRAFYWTLAMQRRFSLRLRALTLNAALVPVSRKQQREQTNSSFLGMSVMETHKSYSLKTLGNQWLLHSVGPLFVPHSSFIVLHCWINELMQLHWFIFIFLPIWTECKVDHF